MEIIHNKGAMIRAGFIALLILSMTSFPSTTNSVETPDTYADLATPNSLLSMPLPAPGPATEVTYDNSFSGAVADEVQEALDSLYSQSHVPASVADSPTIDFTNTGIDGQTISGSVTLSTDPGNSLIYGTDGGLYGLSSGGGGGPVVLPDSVLTTVSVTGSLLGNGTPAFPLRLNGDVGTPGNSRYYGTNASGTKGWFALPGGSGGSGGETLTLDQGTSTLGITLGNTVDLSYLENVDPTLSISNDTLFVSPGGSFVELPASAGGSDEYRWYSAGNGARVLATAGGVSFTRLSANEGKFLVPVNTHLLGVTIHHDQAEGDAIGATYYVQVEATLGNEFVEDLNLGNLPLADFRVASKASAVAAQGAVGSPSRTNKVIQDLTSQPNGVRTAITGATATFYEVELSNYTASTGGGQSVISGMLNLPPVLIAK